MNIPTDPTPDPTKEKKVVKKATKGDPKSISKPVLAWNGPGESKGNAKSLEFCSLEDATLKFPILQLEEKNIQPGATGTLNCGVAESPSGQPALVFLKTMSWGGPESAGNREFRALKRLMAELPNSPVPLRACSFSINFLVPAPFFGISARR